MIKINKIKYDEMTPYFIDGLEKPMFTAAQIARAVGISESTVLSILSKLVFTRGTEAYINGRLMALYSMESALGVFFHKYSKLISNPFREFTAEKMEQLVSMGFATIDPIHNSPEVIKQLVEYVVGVKYEDIPEDRRREADPFKGSILRGAMLTQENLARPEAFITREEMVQIRSLDLALFLISKVTGQSAEELLDRLSLR